MPGQPIYHPLEPSFVVNVTDPGRPRPRFVQVSVQVMTHEPAVVDALKANDPAVRDAMILLLSSQTSTTLIDVTGRDQVRAQAQVAIQGVLKKLLGIDKGVEAVYFTDFVIQ